MENGLLNPKYETKKVAFGSRFTVYSDPNTQAELPDHMPIPDFLHVYELDGESEQSIVELGMFARDLIDETLPETGSILFRNLHKRIANATDFIEFWKGVKSLDGGKKSQWKDMDYQPAFYNRERLGGVVDLATRIAGDTLLRLHNEVAYNPIVPSKFCIYCFQDGKTGGENMLGRNADITKKIPDDVKPFIEAHGGILYRRFYYDDWQSEEKHGLSWQGKTGESTREGAIQYFVDRGWKEEDISFDEEGAMTINFVHPGYRQDEETGEDIWYNIQHHRAEPMADGTWMPRDMLTGIELAAWKSAYALRLQIGDWMVLDNLNMLHGRFPFEEFEDKPRQMMTTYPF